MSDDTQLQGIMLNTWAKTAWDLLLYAETSNAEDAGEDHVWGALREIIGMPLPEAGGPKWGEVVLSDRFRLPQHIQEAIING